MGGVSNEPGGQAWRKQQQQSLLAFAAASRVDGGFAWLDAQGRPDPAKNLELWINARMTYVFSLASLQGASTDLATHGVRSLTTTFHDDAFGGWFAEVDTSGIPIRSSKDCYEHSFVVLAAASATLANIPGGRELLSEALAVHEIRFWDENAGACSESWDRTWQEPEDYRGANSNMHTVEAYLFAADATGEDVWLQRAASICSVLIAHARANEWRLPEHYTSSWRPVMDYNVDRPADPFRPFGATPGHAFEWARLLLQVAASLPDPEPWMREAAEALFAQAVADGATGAPGLPYTTDWSGVPVVAERFHWVMCEAVMAADALGREDNAYAALADRWWRVIDEHFVDPSGGSWFAELSPTMGPSSRTWNGKPDAFHIYNAVTLPDLPLAPTAAITLRTEPTS
ncbi:hypothetical protein BH09ACT10_BH09ACT10_13550 [soil metagenome]